jgi:hypothetical protein
MRRRRRHSSVYWSLHEKIRLIPRRRLRRRHVGKIPDATSDHRRSLPGFGFRRGALIGLNDDDPKGLDALAACDLVRVGVRPERYPRCCCHVSERAWHVDRWRTVRFESFDRHRWHHHAVGCLSSPWLRLARHVETGRLVMNVATLDDGAVRDLYTEAEQHAASMLRERVVTKLATAILMDVKKDCPPPLPSTEHQVRAVLQTLSLRLEEASQALFMAAARLKQQGDGHGANQVYAAAQRTQLAAKAMG